MNPPETPIVEAPTTQPAFLQEQQKPSRPSSSVSRSLIVFLLLAFPPIAWIFMWRDQTYHHWFVKILIISAIISLLSIGSFFLSIVPQLDALYQSLGIPATNKQLIITTNIAGVAFSTMQIFYALYLRQLLKKQSYLSLIQLLITILFLSLNIYVSLIGPLMIIQSVYSLINRI